MPTTARLRGKFDRNLWTQIVWFSARVTATLTLFSLPLANADEGSPPLAEVSPDKPSATLELTITDSGGQPIESASVEVLKWTGHFDSMGALATTDSDGRATLTFPYSDDIFYLKFSAAVYATSMRDVQTSSGETQSITFQLKRPVRGWVQVIADGQPLEGAELSQLDFLDSNQSKVYLTKESGDPIGFEFESSDSRGRLLLPSLPEGAEVELRIVHPKWKTAKVKRLITREAELAVVTLEAGVPVTIELAMLDDERTNLEGKTASISLFAPSGASQDPLSVSHPFSIHDDQIQITAYPAKYDNLRFDMSEYIATPYMMDYPDFSNQNLNLSDSNPATLQLTLRRKIKAKGRIVDADGKGVVGAYVNAMIENPKATEAGSVVDKDSDQATTQTETTQLESSIKSPLNMLRQWTPAGYAETDEEGNYELEVAMGRVRLDVQHDGFFTASVAKECTVTSPESDALPEIRVYPVPTLHGVVLDEHGEPVIGAIVRLQHRGIGAEPLSESSADGSFQLELTQIPRSADGLSPETNVYALAFDPRSNRSGLAQVDLTNSACTGEIVINVSEHAPDWPLTVIEHPKLLTAEALETLHDDGAEQFEAGLPGHTPPNLAEGTWLNSDARSLDDMRGKYVLLDFWFIGCGPCMGDMPSVKLAHQKFFDQGFSVVSVHAIGQLPKAVQKFANENGMNYPIVVDTPNGAISEQFRKLGVDHYPMYILLGPDGKIIYNDATSSDDGLRSDKLEMIYKLLREKAQ